MNLDLLNLLKEKNDYISGEEISEKFNVSRSAIWKQIKALKDAGFIIEGVSRKGYKLISCPDIIFKDKLLSSLNTKLLGKNIEYYKEVSSTNETAKSLADKSTDGTIIISETQSGGKGRLGRVWTSPSGGIWTSFILKPNIEPIYANKVTIIAAATLINTLKKLDIDAKIKWPNDIYINNKKVSGILTEMKCDMDRIHYLIVGIGINVNLEKNDFPQDILDIATSLKIEKNIFFDRNELIKNIIEEFELLYLPFINNNNLKKVIDICKNNSMLIDKEAYLVTQNNQEKVTCIGIDDDGLLIIKDSTGKIKTVLSGEITFHNQ